MFTKQFVGNQSEQCRFHQVHFNFELMNVSRRDKENRSRGMPRRAVLNQPSVYIKYDIKYGALENSYL